MNLNSKKQRELLRQYPFVWEILNKLMEPIGGETGKAVDDLTIEVKKADGDLMFRRAHNVGLGGEKSCIFRSDRKD